MKLRNLCMILGVLLLATILTACGNGDTKDVAGNENGKDLDNSKKLDTNIITIATGGVESPSNIMMTTLAEIYRSEYGINSRTQTSGGSVENLNLMKEGKVEMATNLPDVELQAVEGTGEFKEPIKNINTMGAINSNYLQMITRTDSGIDSISDVKGKRVAVGYPNSGGEINTRKILEVYDLTYDDIDEEYLGYGDAADGLRTGQIDAIFFINSVPNASVLDLARSLDIKFLEIEPDKKQALIEKYPYLIPAEIPAKTYTNEESVETVLIRSSLSVRADLSEEDVYKMTKTLFENLDALEKSHQAAGDISIETAQEGLTVPLHPGAARYFKEVSGK
nr:TAXI family TRAP transporter solute-binding subunit [Fredinandcohnia onubensis]